MKSGIVNSLKVAALALAAIALFGCDDGKKGSGNGGTVYPQCVPTPQNNNCQGQGGGNFSGLQGYLNITNPPAYRQFLKNAIGCSDGWLGTCDQFDDIGYIYLNLNSVATPSPSSGNLGLSIMYNNGYAASTLPFGGQFYPSQNGTITLSQGMVGGSVEFVVQITDVNAAFAPVQMFRVDQFGNRTLLGSANLQRNQPFTPYYPY